MNNLFLTGDRGMGKTTLLNRIIKMNPLSYGGFITEKYETDTEIGFRIISVCDTSENYLIAKINKNNMSVKVFKDSFDKGAVSIIEKSLGSCNCIVLDELGFLEAECFVFQTQIHAVLDSSIPVIGVLKKYDCQFINSIKSRDDVNIIEVTKNNRDSLFKPVLHTFSSFKFNKRQALYINNYPQIL